MAKYNLSNEAKNDLIRIHHYGVSTFGIIQADNYFESFFEYFEIISQRPYSFDFVYYTKEGYRKCVCVCVERIPYITPLCLMQKTR